MRSLLYVASVVMLAGSAFSAAAAQITLLNHGEGALAAQLSAIHGAKHSVDYMTWEADPCSSSTQAVLDAMAERAANGVHVRLLVDGYALQNGQEALFNSFASQHGIEFKAYNDHTFFLKQPFRSHIKLLSVDAGRASAVYFALGRNLTDSYFGLSSTFNMSGRDLMIAGTNGNQPKAAFDNIWNSSWTAYSKIRASGLKGSCLSESSADKIVSAHYSDRADSIVASLPQFSCANVDFFMDDPKFINAGNSDQLSGHGGGNDMGRDYMNAERLQKKHTSAKMLAFIGSAGKSLYMENQYYLPTFQLRDALTAARDRGVKIMILTNSTARVDGGLSGTMTRQMQNAARRDSQKNMMIFPISGIGALRSEGKTTGTSKVRWYIHSKTAVADHQDVYVGSFNLDQLSFANNLESGAIIRGCPTLAAAIETEYSDMVQIFKTDAKSCAKCKSESPQEDLLGAAFGWLASGFF